VTQRDFDIWLHGFARATREAPPHAISRVFGIPIHAAEALVATLPRVVKRDASADQAERLVHALESIGGVAEAIPTRVVPAPVLVVGTQPAHLKPETIVRHAPRSGAQREQPVLASAASSGETLKIGTHELAAYHPALVGGPDATLVDPEPPRWSDAELARVHPTAALAAGEPRGRWDDIELAPPDELATPISLSPIALTPVALSPASPGSEPARVWKDPMALPPRDQPLRSAGMRTPAERMRMLGRARSQRPPSIRPSIVAPDANFGDALMALTRGDFRGATKASPTLSFAVIVTGVTLAFLAAYAAW
jgi:hypothetical protein